MGRVVITECDLGQGEIEREELGEEHELVVLRARNRQQVMAGIDGADVLMVQYASIDDEVMSAVPSLKGIVRYGMGLDNIDLDAASERGIVVKNVDDFCVDEVADHAVAMIVSAHRGLWILDRAVKAGGWGPDLEPAPAPPDETVVGLAGFGRIGQRVAHQLNRLGFGIAFWDPFLKEPAPPHARQVGSLHELATECSYLTLHVPLTRDTKGLIGGAVLAALGPHGHLINTGRGGLVDERALLDALELGKISSASLDVLDIEPPAGSTTSAALARHGRVLVTPHIAYLSTRSVPILRRNAARRAREIMQ